MYGFKTGVSNDDGNDVLVIECDDVLMAALFDVMVDGLNVPALADPLLVLDIGLSIPIVLKFVLKPDDFVAAGGLIF